MPKIEFKMQIASTLEQTLSAVNDIGFLSSAIPGVISVTQKGDNSAEWVMEVKKGFMRRRTALDVEFSLTTKNNVHEFDLKASGKEILLKGTISLIPTIEPGKTDIKVDLDYEAFGPLKHIINNVVGEMITEFPDKFNSKLKQFTASHQT
ncbi:MAG: SRPBCC domain-containing protein [Candidatus Thermoplasmatota archaeon]|uniref:SRPBCC family protein n=1 Tax=Candidatus Sysuiplasma superficiale TaxID=2823368 RepID=A0A8J8CGH9_9ARCH|nr:hypothetical protein [Candidatus Sysuiplasma superficiale]MCL5252758.1 SRPBCC domain-containing protein [Candidatus Thermoplasmatota archaeon]